MSVQRICVVGNIASGKSHFARELGAALDLPVFHLDDEYWLAGGAHVSREHFLARQRDMIEHERWVVDGSYCEFGLEQRFRAAQAVVFLDLPTWSCVRRAVARHKATGGGSSTARRGPWRASAMRVALLGETVLFKAIQRPRILAAAAAAGVALWRIRAWRDEAAVLGVLRAR